MAFKLYSKIETWEYEMYTDPDPWNTISVLLQTITDAYTKILKRRRFMGYINPRSRIMEIDGRPARTIT